MNASYEIEGARLKQQFIEQGHLDWLCRKCGEPIAKHPTPKMVKDGRCAHCLGHTRNLRYRQFPDVVIQQNA